MKGLGMLRATRPERTLARTAEVRGFGFFHGADVTLRFSPADAGTGMVFVRTDLPDRPAVPARIDKVIPSQRRTTIRQGAAAVEMIEHVMAALAGLQIDNCVIHIDAGECPGCDGSSQAFVEVLDRAGIVEQGRMRQGLVLDRSVSVRRRRRDPGSPPRRAGRFDALLSPRLRPRLHDSSPEPMPGLVSQHVSQMSWRPAARFCSNRKPPPSAPPVSGLEPRRPIC